MPLPEGSIKADNYIFIILCLNAGLLYGYHSGIIGPALAETNDHFPLEGIIGKNYENEVPSIIASAFILGAMPLALSGGYITKKFGRKRPMILASILAGAGGGVTLISIDTVTFCLCRVLTGMGVGLASYVVPLYLSEVVPVHQIARVMGVFPIGLVGGIFLSYVVGVIAALDSLDLSEEVQFLIVFGTPLIFNFAFFCSTLLLSESDVYIFSVQHLVEGGEVHSHSEKITCGVFVNAIGMAATQQLVGIMAVINFTPKIFESVGSHNQLLESMATNGMNFVGTCLSAYVVKYFQPKYLLSLNLGLLALALFAIAVGIEFFSDDAEFIIVIALCVFFLTYALGPGPLFYVIIADLFHECRDEGMSLATFFLWSFNLFTVASWNTLLKYLGSSGVFFLYAGFSTACTVFAACLPQQKTDEEKFEKLVTDVSRKTATGQGLTPSWSRQISNTRPSMRGSINTATVSGSITSSELGWSVGGAWDPVSS